MTHPDTHEAKARLTLCVSGLMINERGHSLLIARIAAALREAEAAAVARTKREDAELARGGHLPSHPGYYPKARRDAAAVILASMEKPDAE